MLYSKIPLKFRSTVSLNYSSSIAAIVPRSALLEKKTSDRIVTGLKRTCRREEGWSSTAPISRSFARVLHTYYQNIR